MERVIDTNQETGQHRQRLGALKSTVVSLENGVKFISLIREVLEGIQVLNNFFFP